MKINNDNSKISTNPITQYNVKYQKPMECPIFYFKKSNIKLSKLIIDSHFIKVIDNIRSNLSKPSRILYTAFTSNFRSIPGRICGIFIDYNVHLYF